MSKKDVAEEIARLENRDKDADAVDAEALAFVVDALVKGHTRAQLDARLERLREEVAREDTEPKDGAAEETPPGTDVVPAAEESAPLVPTTSKWEQIVGMAEYLAKSNLVSPALRGRPRDVGLVMLKAYDLGIPLTMGLDELYVVNGKVGMEGSLMMALVRRAGHSITVDPSSDRNAAAVHGVRKDTGDVGTATFDLQDAEDAELIQGVDRDGRPIPIKDKKVWRQYTRAMLIWRATARLCRELFSDCLAGVNYTPEELGYIDVEEVSDRAGASAGGGEEASVTLAQQRSGIAARIADLPDEFRDRLREAWKARNLPGPDGLSPAAIRTALGLLEAAEEDARRAQEAATADVDDAELVDDTEEAGKDTDARDHAETAPGADAHEELPADKTGEDRDDGAATSDEPLCLGGCGENLSAGPESPNHPGYHATCEPFGK